MSSAKSSLLFFANRPELYDNLIGKLYKLKDVFIISIKNSSIEQMRSFLMTHKKCIILFIVEKSKDSAMSMLYKVCNCMFNPPYIIVIFKNAAHRLQSHIKAHNNFKIFHMDSKNYMDDLVVDWIKKICIWLDFSIIFPRMHSYMLSSARFKISAYLKKVGVFPYLTGYKYVVDAIELYTDNPNLCMTKDIYKILAERYKTNSMNIDRCMRHAIDAAWRNSKVNKAESNGDKPSVFKFIRYVSEKISQKNIINTKKT